MYEWKRTKSTIAQVKPGTYKTFRSGKNKTTDSS